MRILLISLIMFLGSFAIAGDGNGSSGGGNIYGDRLNPWFLPNTPVATYCISISPDFSDLDETTIHSLVKKSFSFWKNAFANNYDVNFSNEVLDLKLATQEFLKSEKCETADIQFQFGFLTTEQLKSIPDPTRVIGMAKSTSYDSRNLKGKGFIYISPEKGELRPTDPTHHKTPWSIRNGELLQWALNHEVGHIFGLQDDFLNDNGLMHALMVQRLTSKESIENVNDSKIFISSPLGCNKDYDYYEIGEMSVPASEELPKFLGLPSHFKYELISGDKMLRVMANDKEIGSIDLSRTNVSSIANTGAIRLYLNPDQTAFPQVRRSDLGTTIDLYRLTASLQMKNLTFKLTNGNTLPAFVTLDQNCKPTIGGVFKKQMFFDVLMGF